MTLTRKRRIEGLVRGLNDGGAIAAPGYAVPRPPLEIAVDDERLTVFSLIAARQKRWL